MRRAEIWLVLAATGLTVAFVGVRPASAWLGPSSECSSAVVVDGELRCGDDAVLSVAAACGEGHDVIAGDVIDHACAERSRMPGEDLERLGVPVDVNAAAASDLESLRGVGRVVAQRIVDGRPYARVEDLDRVKGIGSKTLAAMRPRVVVEPPRIASHP